MGRKCCVPKCVYDVENPTSCFKFPSDEKLKAVWLENIGRKDAFNTKYLGVCILHFDAKYIKRVNEHGKLMERPRLKEDSIPTIFNYNTDGVSEVFILNQDVVDEDLIHGFNHFKFEHRNHINLFGWSTFKDENSISFYKLKQKDDGNIIVVYNIYIDFEMNIEIFNNGERMNIDCFKDIITRRKRLHLFSELTKIILRCDEFDDAELNEPDNAEKMKKHLEDALKCLSVAKNVMKNIEDYEYSNCVNILHDQLVQLTSNRRKYSINTMLCGYSIFIQSAKTYELIRNWRILILPHRTTLINLGRFQDVNPNSTTSNMKYLKKVESNLKDVEKFIIVQMDEIYVDPKVSYWKRLEGFAENVDEAASTVLGVMVSSCFGKMKEIANLIPMKNGTGTDLKRYSLDVIKSLQAIGFIVMALVTDNNRINQNLFSQLAPDGSFSFINPDFTNRVIRLMYDSIHVFKNYRNCWINLKDEDKSFFYPKFEDPSIIQLASFGDLRKLYHSEKLKMIKEAPKLNTKTLYPSSFDRQRVPLALNIIHPTTIAALRTKSCFETAKFLEIIRVWFTIMNNTTEKAEVGVGVEKWFEKITSPEGFQVQFLKKFVVWLKRWKDLRQLLHTGGLTDDTFKAAISCTEGMIGLITDAFKTCGIESFSPGRIQTNGLEKRFGVYRRLSGCHYNVSVRQIMESEKKLRIRNLMSNIPNEMQVAKYTVQKEKTIDLTSYWDLLDSNYLQNFKDYDYGSFIYVSGYTGYQVITYLKCSYCRDLIVKCKGDKTNDDYFDFLQRGGLIVPTENCVFILIHMNAIFNELRSDSQMRRIFQFSEDPSNTLVLLTLEGIERNDNFIVDWNDTCLCGSTYKKLFFPVLTTFANILLNNYRKKINDINLLRKLNKRKSEKSKHNEDDEKNKKIDEPKNRKGAIYEKIQ